MADQPRRGSSGDFSVEEITKVGSDPIENIDRRTKKAATEMSQTLTTIRMVRDEVREAVKRDEQEHKRLTDGLGAVSKQQDDLATEFKDLRGEFADLRSEFADVRVDFAKADTKLDILVGDIQSNKRVAERREIADVETDAVRKQAAIEDAADAKKVQRARSLKIWALVGSIVGSGGIAATVIAALLGKC